MFDPLTLSIVLAYFLLRRGGENVIWAARGGKGDPPSFRRWQTRQKARAAGEKTGTGRSDVRNFWANWMQDAHASAHEWRQRKYGRRWEERQRRWQKEDLEHQQQRLLAPCVFCGANRGMDCRPGCPEREAHDTNSGKALKPEPQVEPTKPVQVDEPAPAETPIPTKDEVTPSTVLIDWKDTPDRQDTTKPIGQAFNGTPENSGVGSPNVVVMNLINTGPTPINKYRAAANQPETQEDNNGGNMTTPAVRHHGAAAIPGEFVGYEATVAGWNEIERLGAELDAAYEMQMAALRGNKADNQTIGKVANAREKNEQHMLAAGEAKTDWETRQGAVKDVKDATGARGDEALHIN
jgi:hypothetical protein